MAAKIALPAKPRVTQILRRCENSAEAHQRTPSPTRSSIGNPKPEALADSLQPPTTSMSHAPLPRSNKVLLVDGDVRTTQRLAELLREDGFDVEVARDGAAAIARLAREPLPDTLITELRIPFADGTAVARYARSQRPGLRVVVVTGYPNSLVPAGFGNPPPVVFAKPLDYAQLLRELQEPIGADEDSRASPTSPES